MTRPVRPSELAATLDRDLDLLARLRADLPRVVATLRDWSSGIRSGGAASGAGSVSDPTGHAALTADEWAGRRHRLERLVATIHAAALNAERIRADVLAPPVERAPAARGLVHCANLHGCPDDAWATKAGRCDTCYGYQRRTGRDRRLSGQPRGARRSGEERGEVDDITAKA